MGAYYAVPGEISVPASITREQLQTVLEGGQVRVTLNELTGESRMLSLNPGQEDTPYNFLIHEAGEETAGQGYETGSGRITTRMNITCGRPAGIR